MALNVGSVNVHNVFNALPKGMTCIDRRSTMLHRDWAIIGKDRSIGQMAEAMWLVLLSIQKPNECI